MFIVTEYAALNEQACQRIVSYKMADHNMIILIL